MINNNPFIKKTKEKDEEIEEVVKVKKTRKVKNEEDKENIFIKQDKPKKKLKKEIEKVEKVNPWTIINSYMNLVRDNNSTKEDVINLLQPIANINPTQLNFIIYCVNKYLIYNISTRMILDQIVRMSQLLEPMDYLITYYILCKNKRCQFPLYLPFYYINQNKYKSYILEKTNLSEDEFAILCMRNEEKTLKDLFYLVKEI